MLHYDMIRYEIMYLKTLDRHFNTDHSLLCSTYDRPDDFRRLISQILERHFLGDQDRIKIARKMNRPGFPGECFICELRLPDHRFRWKHNKLFLLLPEEYGPAFPAIVDCYTSPPT